MSEPRPLLVRTPDEALGAPVLERVVIGEHVFLIERPTDTEATLEPPGGALGRYMPYWVDLWPAARMLAKWIVRQRWPEGIQALEVGCGLGLPGVAALSMGLRVTFSDCDSSALKFASRNARLNGFTAFDTLHMDWSHPPQGVLYPILLASDLLYEERNVAPLVALIDRLLTDDGICLLTDADRVPSETLRRLLSERGLPFTTQTLRAGEPGGRRLKGTLYRITRGVLGEKV
jgi:predicted nicotinamide N-methyase